MRALLPDIFAGIGFIALMAGIFLQFGLAPTLAIGGMIMMAFGLAAARRLS